MQETGTPAGGPRVCEGCRGGKFRPDHTPMVLTGETREMRERRRAPAARAFAGRMAASTTDLPGVSQPAPLRQHEQTAARERGGLRALTKPTTAKIALIYGKSEAIFASCVSCTCILRSLTSM